jgi:DNA methylase
MSAPYYADGTVTIFDGEVEPRLPLVGDLAIFDPPYNVGITYDADPNGDTLGGSTYWRFIRTCLDGMHAPNLVWTPGTKNIGKALEVITGHVLLDDEPNPWTFRRLLGWHKKEFAGDKFNGGPAMCWEPIIWATRGPATFNKVFGVRGRDFLVVPSTHGHGIDHPCPKPPEVYRWLIGLFCPEGGTVIDPTCGSGTALMEAKHLSRKAIGVERSLAYCSIAAGRCAREVLPFKPWPTPDPLDFASPVRPPLVEKGEKP